MAGKDKRLSPYGKENVIKIVLMGPANAGKSELGNCLEEIFNVERQSNESRNETLKGNPGPIGENSRVGNDTKTVVPSSYKPTPGVAFYKFSIRKARSNENEQGQELQFIHWELGGQERYHILWSVWWAGARGVMVVLDSCKTSDDNYLKEARRIIEIIETKIKRPYIICANKQDLPARMLPTELHLRLQLSTHPNYLGTYPLSALTGENVKEVFLRFLSSIELGYL
ncbi:MAG: GTPase domain-containing protein [Promethearchaeota archaeon]